MQIGADHLDVKMDLVVDSMAKLFSIITGKTPRFKVSLIDEQGCGSSLLACEDGLNQGQDLLQTALECSLPLVTIVRQH